MEIVVNKRGPKEYYDEFLYILYEYKRFLKNPKTKANSFTKMMTFNIVLGVIGLVLMIVSYIVFKDTIFMIFIIALIFVSVFTIPIYTQGKKRLNDMMNDTQEKIIKIEDEGITYKDNDKLYQISWNKIKCILINKYTVAFFPSTIDTLMISISNEYLDDILKGIEEVNKKELIVDNRSLYN